MLRPDALDATIRTPQRGSKERYGMEMAREDVTRILQDLAGGDGRAAEDLLPLVYEELRKLAHARMAKEKAGLTLEPTALVHEAYMRVVGSRDGQWWDNRGHFFAAAALAMRRILVERARHARRLKHGGGRKREELHENAATAESGEPIDLLALDEALSRLEVYDARKAQIVSLRYFGGLTIDEVAGAMNLSPATVKNEWTFARAWLKRQMVGNDAEEGTSGA
jgi:RNA polymerase sigma factor (TIGR02999 family)